MPEKLRIIVSGMAATYPFGGVFWDYMNYVEGFHQLGHEVLYIEDNGSWCYNPETQTFQENGSQNALRLSKGIQKLNPELSDKWFYRDSLGKTYGKPWEEVKDFCKSSDLFINISAASMFREEYFSARVKMFIDTDPLYTQGEIAEDQSESSDKKHLRRYDRLLQHDGHFTFGENIGQPDCTIPTGLFNWKTTRQPIAMQHFRDHMVQPDKRRPVLTTIASWEPQEDLPVVNGKKLYGKSMEFLRFIDLPKKCSYPIEVAISGPIPYDKFISKKWDLIDGYSVSKDPWIYRDYLAHSMAEWSVAKNAYVHSNSGWFSCRSACYLALGVPVIVQDTGFDRIIPTGEGVFSFNTIEQALDAIDQVFRDPVRHSKAAQEIAFEYFDSDKVLTDLIDKTSIIS